MDSPASEVQTSIPTGDPGSYDAVLNNPPPPCSPIQASLHDSQSHYRCAHQLVEETASRNPAATAVQFKSRTLSYADLDRRSNQLAHLLQREGVGPEVLVGLCLERSIEMVVALLGVLKAGGAYVPLDPAYPTDRIKYVLGDARVKLLVTQEPPLASLLSASGDVIFLDPEWQAIQHEDCAPVMVDVSPENLAYVIYTSGSTGRPKGVQIEHRSLVNFLCSMRREPGMTENDILLAVTTLSFDIAGLELYLPLLAGGRLVVAPRDATVDGRLLGELLKQSGANTMQATPTTWRLLFESGWKGDPKLKVLVGGEALSPDLAQQLAQSCGSVWNMYGPTETTIWSSIYRVEGIEEKLVPIGKPIANTTLYVLDGMRRPVSPGFEGELYIGGDGLARGYFERPELTAEKFLTDSFSSLPNARMYRTGDLARHLPDGNVEFLGRIDHQVKIRGFRIELGEIEAVLEQHDCVSQSVVIAREDNPGDKQLVAYVVPRSPSLNAGALREHVTKQLPDYMVPSAFVRIAKLPLTPNGKVDRKALPAPTARDFETDSEFVAPRDATERQLVRTWEDVLGIRPISVTANFFELGGRSLLAARLFTKILRTFGRELPLSTLFRSPTIELLAKELGPTQPPAEYPTLVAIQRNGAKPPFFCVHGGAGSTLFLHRLARHLAPDQPFYGIEPEGLDGKKFQHRTVEEMAAYYLSEIRRVQPHGPYYLGGYCFGGLVAFEMARLLHEEQEETALVALFSAELRFHRWATQLREASPPRPIMVRVARLFSSPTLSLRQELGRLYWRAYHLVQKQMYRMLLAWGFRIPPDMRTRYVAEMLLSAERNYKPRRYAGTIALFHGPTSNGYGPELGWEGLAEAFEHHVIGDHALVNRRDIMNEPLVRITAKQLARYFNTNREVPVSHLAVMEH